MPKTIWFVFQAVVFLAAIAVLMDQNYILDPLHPVLRRLTTPVNSLFEAIWQLIRNQRLTPNLSR